VERHAARVAELLERLAEAGDVAVAEDAPHARDEAGLDAVALGVLGREESDDGLPDRQADRAHGRSSPSRSSAQPPAGSRHRRLGAIDYHYTRRSPRASRRTLTRSRRLR
jgi:hypothetical protein